MKTVARRTPSALALCALCAACASSPADIVPPSDFVGPAARYDCEGLPVVARPGTESVTLEIDGRTESVPKAPAASGAKYESGVDASYRLFWTKGDTARLALGDDRWLSCVALATTGETVVANAASGTIGAGRPAGLDAFEAHGNEPPWTLAMLEGSVVFERGYDGAGTIATLRERSTSAEGTRYVANADGRALTVDVVSGPCTDGMSGMAYPDTVTVELGGEVSRGCGGEPASLLVGDEWRIERVGDAVALDEAPATLAFGDDGGAGGSTGCNRWSASWVLTGESLVLERFASTRRACRGPVGEQETRLLAALEAVRGFAVREDGALVLTGGDGGDIVARRG